MICSYYQELISRMLDEDLSPVEQNVLLAHLPNCEACSAMYKSFSALSEALEDQLEEPPERLVVTGGTSTTLVALTKALVPYDSAQVHLARLTRAEVEAQELRLAGITAAQRATLPGIQAKRAPVILGGAVAVGEVMRAAGVDELTVSESDLLFGLSLVTAATVEGRPSPVGWHPEL